MGLFSDKEYERMTLEAAANLDEFTEQDITDLFDAMHVLAVNAALLENWRHECTSISWNVEAKEVRWTITEKGHEAVQSMLTPEQRDALAEARSSGR